MKVIFLDIDGVMNNRQMIYDDGMDAIGEEMLHRLSMIVKATGAKIVLSSTWRILEKNRDLVTKALARHNMEYIDVTPRLFSGHRGGEIGCWLQEHPEVERFAVLDDDPNANIGQTLFRCDFEIGLTDDIAAQAIEYLNET
jgi:hypothetical protein